MDSERMRHGRKANLLPLDPCPIRTIGLTAKPRCVLIDVILENTVPPAEFAHALKREYSLHVRLPLTNLFYFYRNHAVPNALPGFDSGTIYDGPTTEQTADRRRVEFPIISASCRHRRWITGRRAAAVPVKLFHVSLRNRWPAPAAAVWEQACWRSRRSVRRVPRPYELRL